VSPVTARDRARGDDVADSTFGDGRPVWLGRLDKVRNVPADGHRYPPADSLITERGCRIYFGRA
jgi:hypothetical protein